MKRVHVCSFVSRDGKSCPNLAPCELHARPKNASWSKDRDHRAQGQFRKNVLARDNHRCVKCGSTDHLVAHHVKPGYSTSSGITLCTTCHKEIDPHAR